MTSTTVTTKPFEGQKPGTSGLRKPVATFTKPNYTENFVQSIFNALEGRACGRTLIVGGDGRYFMQEAIEKIIQMAAANKVGKLVIGANGILSTPAASHLIRKKKALGAIVLTASHNPGGQSGDFGIKFNSSNGGPAAEAITDLIYEHSTNITEYSICKDLKPMFSIVGRQNYRMENGKFFQLEIVDPEHAYTELMRRVFDFNVIKTFVNSGDCQIVVNGMNGVTGPYLRKLIIEEFGLTEESILNGTPLKDFGGLHPDPNMTYAADFVKLMNTGKYHFGGAFDGDGDRNMLLGQKGFFINPSDSVALIAANAECIPYFQKHKLKGVARSMPTSGALDRVAQKLGVECYEVPTGWKFFGNLMDADKLSICGEESFGTGSNHIREKDGIWTFLAWLSILAHTKKTPEQLLEEHWKEFGRNFYTRYDYENVSSDGANKMIASLRALISKKTEVGKKYGDYTVKGMDDFSYTDPIDKSVSDKQGIRIMFDDGSRIIYRLSGTGSQGATVRVYIESYVTDAKKISQDTQQILKPLVKIALQISKLIEVTGRETPTVIT